MKTALVTGAAGFLGKNLATALKRRDDVELVAFARGDDRTVLESGLAKADIVYHLAGVNRPKTEEEFAEGNLELTREILRLLAKAGRAPTVVLPSSTQAELDNPYGRSKKAAEDAVLEFAHDVGAAVCIYRLPNIFGKWSRPDYNSVVATFCHRIARGLDITIRDPDHELELVYIDDVVQQFVGHLDRAPDRQKQRYSIAKTFGVTLGALAAKLETINKGRDSLVIPDMADDLMRYLSTTYLSFLPEQHFGSPVELHTDDRGWLFELIKSDHFGQIFVSTTRPGITRGNHYHDTKIEKFCLIKGNGLIRFRALDSEEILEYSVTDEAIQIVDIPPGYTHSIENTGDHEMIVLFWANEIFSQEKPDTYFVEVLP